MNKFPYNSEIIKENIEDILMQCSSQMEWQGKDWYYSAQRIAIDFSAKYKKSTIITSALISVLSPQKEWFHNLRLVDEFLLTKGERCRHTNAQTEKAKCIYNLNDATISQIEIILSGLKTINFFHNIYHPDNVNYCTIDSHMAQLMTGDFERKSLKKKQYEFLKDELI